jgi:hypothetical protein
MDKWGNPKQSWKFGMPWTKWGNPKWRQFDTKYLKDFLVKHLSSRIDLKCNDAQNIWLCDMPEEI